MRAALLGGMEKKDEANTRKSASGPGAAVSTKLTTCAITDTGRKRTRNEDAFLVDDERRLFVVADGIGGHAGGEVASRLAVDVIGETLGRVESHEITLLGQDLLRFAFRRANHAVHAHAKEAFPGQSIGTTAVALLFGRTHAAVAHVGDSRAYRVRGGGMLRLTEDHSFVAEQVRHGLITESEARRHPRRNWILRSVGHDESVEVDAAITPLAPGDRFVLCSDGLCGLVEDDEIAACVRESGSLDGAAARLVALANERGGDDNITVLVVRVDALATEVAPCA